MTERTVPIVGMTCAACESTVTAALAGVPGVDRVQASAKKGSVVISGDRLPSDSQLALALQDTHYSLGVNPWWSRDRVAWRDAALGAVVAAIIGVVVLWWEPASGWGFTAASGAMGLALAAAGLGVAASVSSCIATVGGLVLAISATRAGDRRRGVSAHVAFNAGRIVGFAALGAIAASLGSVLALNRMAFAVVLGVVAIATALLGLRLTELSPRVAGWQLTLPGRWGAWASSATGERGGLAGVAGLGALTFFLPCAFTQIAQVMAFASGSAWVGALAMGAFALGTTPGLLALGIAAATSAAASARRPLRVLGAVMVGFAVVTATGLVSGTGLFTLATPAPTERTSNVADGPRGQEVATSTVADGYEPRVSVVYVGEPVEWTISAKNLTCANMLDADSLGLERIVVMDEPVTVQFTIDEPGTYPFECVMGMYTGSFVAIERDAAARS